MTSDRQTRLRALNPTGSFIVQAPAGSGKTEVLTQRFLKLLAGVERPERVLAITFTRKATQEMRTRITTRLSQAQAGVVPEMPHEQEAVALAGKVLARDRERGWKLLHSPGRLRINTVDGLCTQILSRDPVLGPRWADAPVLEHPDPLYREAVRGMFRDIDDLVASGNRQAAQARASLVRLLVYLGGDSRRLESLLVDMLRQRSLWRRHLATGHDALEHLLQHRQERALQAFAQALGEERLAEAGALAATLGFDSGVSPADVESRLRAAHRLADHLTTASNKARKPGGISKRIFPDMTDDQLPALARLKDIYAQWHEEDAARVQLERMAAWPPLDTTAEQGAERRQLLDDARTVLSLARTELQSLMDERGVADFTAVSEAALESLGSDTEPADVLLAEDARIDHILMDEFQDTSYAQYQLVYRLTAGWQPADGRTLFLVGDPMQSIYRFREANVGFFNDVVRRGRLGHVPLEALRLESNFRSNSELIAWFNTTFPGVFPRHDESDSGAVSYTAVKAEVGSGGRVCLHALHAGAQEHDQGDVIAQAIAQARREHEEPSIAILVRSREQVPEIAAGLRRHDITFECVDIGRLAGRGVVQDLVALTRALVHPLDRVAWIGLLRAPWCGLPVGEIHRLLGDDAARPVIEALMDCPPTGASLPDESMQRVRRLAQTMRRALDHAAAADLAERVEVAWIQLGGPLSCREGSDLDNADAFFDVLHELGAEGELEVVERLDEALQHRFAVSRPAPVQVMTIHKAKGLEFDVVIVPDLQRRSGRGRQPLIQVQEFAQEPDDDEPGRGVLMAPLTPRSEAEISVYRYLNGVDAEREQFENQRVLYVACTRARQALHLVATLGRTAAGEPAFLSNTFVKLLEDAFRAQAKLPEQFDTNQEIASGESADTPYAEFPLTRLAGLPLLQWGEEPTDREIWEMPELPDREAVAVGVVLHRWLELMHDHPEPAWNAARIDHSQSSIRGSLLRAGAPDKALSRLVSRCVDILKRLAEEGWPARLPGSSPEEGDQMAESWSELVIYSRDGMSLGQHAIDLLIRDRRGRLQIVDYKTSGLSEAAADAVKRRQAQLERYRALVEALQCGQVSDSRVEILDRESESG